MNLLDDLRGMDVTEAGRYAKCGLCHRPVNHTGIPLFYVVKIERWGFDVDAIRQREGLAMMLNSHVLADVMGPRRPVARCVMETRTLGVCEDCAMAGTSHAVARMAESATPAKPEKPEETDEAPATDGEVPHAG